MHAFPQGRRFLVAAAAAATVFTATVSTAQQSSPAPIWPAGLGAVSAPNADPFPSTYRPFPSRPTLIRNVRIFTGVGPAIANGSLLIENGRITAVGTNVAAPAGAVIIDGAGKSVTAGVIDTHTHLGVYPAPGTAAHNDGNEATAPVTAHVWAEHSVWP
jgi:hypothetical protein